jgi:hypothetical protein
MIFSTGIDSGSTPLVVAAVGFIGIIVAAVVGPMIVARRAARDRRAERVEEREERDVERAADKQRAKDERLEDLEAQEAVRKEALRQQDEVARTLEVAASKLKQDQEKTAAKLLADQELTREAAEEVARIAAEGRSATDAQLGEIRGMTESTHTLVNSNMDEQKRIALRLAEDGLDSKRRELVGLREIVRLREEMGQEPTSEALDAIHASQESIARTNTYIEDLKAELEDRARQLKIVEDKAAASAKGGD